MPKFLTKIPRVLVMITPTSQKVLREKTLGIMRYAHFHGPWEIQVMDDRPFITKLDTFKNWQPDGIITRESAEVLAALNTRARKIPTVFFDADQPGPQNCMSVHHAVRQASEAVADYYVQAGLAHFAYVGSVSEPQPFWSSERAEGFASRLMKNGQACAIYKPKNAKDWGIEQKHMRKWLLGLPKPCGLFAAFDLQAKQVLDTCLTAGIRVPEEISLIGVDNDEMICENTLPTLSSVQADFEGGGYRAAELLDRLMRNKVRKPVHLSYGFKRIVHRHSSQVTQKTSWLVTRAGEFIRLNACEGITVLDVANHLRVSRSYVDKRFRKELGHSVLGEIQARRLERLRILLRETTRPISEIGERCGYRTEAYLKRLFRKTYGITMRDYRASGAR
jgi:LacI family transcriptional regulator